MCRETGKGPQSRPWGCRQLGSEGGEPAKGAGEGPPKGQEGKPGRVESSWGQGGGGKKACQQEGAVHCIGR